MFCAGQYRLTEKGYEYFFCAGQYRLTEKGYEYFFKNLEI